MMSASVEWYEFAAPSLLAAAIADVVSSDLRQAIDERGQAILAVSGGSTPATFFRALARKPLQWDAITVTLVDERFVPPSSERSNERLVRENLLQADASNAQFFGLFDDCGLEQAAARADDWFSAQQYPVDVAVLGMGTDGHTASFFADAGNLDELLDPSSGKRVLAVQSAAAGEPRLTVTLDLLKSVRNTYVHIEGQSKKELLVDILAEQASAPVGAVLKNLTHSADIYWALGEKT